MIPKYIERDEGTLIRDMGVWATNTVYSAWNIVSVSGVVYRCILGHISGSASQPGVGESWSTYWAIFGPVGANRGLTIILDGGGAVLTGGVKGGFEVPFNMNISCGKITSLDGISGSLQIDLRKSTYANFPPTSADNIHSFNLVSNVKMSENVDLDVSAGEWVLINIESVTNIKIAALSLILGSS